MAGNMGAPRGGMRGGMPRGARMPGQKMDFGVLKRVFSYFKDYKLKFILAICCIIVSALSTVATSLSIGYLIDDVIVPMVNKGAFDAGLMWKYILIMVVIYLVGMLATYVNARIFVVISQGILKSIRDDMFRHMQTLPIRYFDQNTHGDLMSHFTSDTDTLRQLLAQTIPQIFSAIITVVSVFFSMVLSSIWLTLFVLAFVFLMTKIMAKIAKKSGKYFVEQQQKLGALNGYVEEMVNGQKVVKVFNHEPASIQGFEKVNNELREAGRKANTFASLMGPFMNNLGHLQYVLLAVLGAIFVGNRIMNLTLLGTSILTTGTVVAFLQLSRSFTQTVNNITQQASAVVMAMAGAKRIFEVIDAEPEVDEGKVTLVNTREENGVITECAERTGNWAWKKGDELIPLRGDVRFDHVSFEYRENHEILHDITLYAKPGQKVAFVGSTGAGKTTITNLINRFYDIKKGAITYDGIPVSDIRKEDLRHSLGMVLQDVNLFTGTIRENIRYGKLDATEEEIVAAAKLANADDFIRRLPDGYDTVIDGSGSQLSQGQRQLLSIARAAIQDPPVMILDEATSSIDTRTEAIIGRGMDALMKDRTVFVIAHRLSTVRDANVIMVLEHGVIIERGTHEELIEQKGKYYQLYTGAFELD